VAYVVLQWIKSSQYFMPKGSDPFWVSAAVLSSTAIAAAATAGYLYREEIAGFWRLGISSNGHNVPAKQPAGFALDTASLIEQDTRYVCTHDKFQPPLLIQTEASNVTGQTVPPLSDDIGAAVGTCCGPASPTATAADELQDVAGQHITIDSSEVAASQHLNPLQPAPAGCLTGKGAPSAAMDTAEGAASTSDDARPADATAAAAAALQAGSSNSRVTAVPLDEGPFAQADAASLQLAEELQQQQDGLKPCRPPCLAVPPLGRTLSSSSSGLMTPSSGAGSTSFGTASPHSSSGGGIRQRRHFNTSK
jgi:hypothetical protein